MNSDNKENADSLFMKRWAVLIALLGILWLLMKIM